MHYRNIILSCLILPFLALQSFTINEVDSPPNVLIIYIDDMNDYNGTRGRQAVIPSIDKLSEEGVKFLLAHCVVPACNPSRTAILTGQRPETTGQYENANCFRDAPAGGITAEKRN